MDFRLPELPYERDAFDPRFLSRESFDFHYGKHHQAYIEKTNQLVRENGASGETLEDLIIRADGSLFNNAAQAWNHAFYWLSLSPDRPRPSDRMGLALQDAFGSIEEFRRLWTEAGQQQFGSGWVWLVKDGKNQLSVITTPNAENPIRQGKIPLLTADVWEHAYYIDHRNDRGGFLGRFLDHVDWDFVEANLQDEKWLTLTDRMTEDVDLESREGVLPPPRNPENPRAPIADI